MLIIEKIVKEIFQLINCLTSTQEDLGLVPGTHVKGQAWQYALVPVLGVGVGMWVPGAPREASPA